MLDDLELVRGEDSAAEKIRQRAEGINAHISEQMVAADLPLSQDSDATSGK